MRGQYAVSKTRPGATPHLAVGVAGRFPFNSPQIGPETADPPLLKAHQRALAMYRASNFKREMKWFVRRHIFQKPGTRRWLEAGLLTPFLVWPLCGCQIVSGSQASSLVRVIDASSNAPAVDVYIGKTEIAQNIAAGTITNYAILAPALETISIDATGTTKPLATVSGDLQSAQEHSVYIADSGKSFTTTLLVDQSTAAPVGDFSVRFVQGANTTGNVDVYFVASGETFKGETPIVENFAPGLTTDYLNVPDGSYQLVVTKTGSITPLYTGSSVTYASGEVRTMLIVDEPTIDQQPVNVVVGDDLN